MSEKSKVRLQVVLMLLAGLPLNALGHYFITNEPFGPSFQGSTIALVILSGLMIALPEPFTSSEARKRRQRIWNNRVALLVVLGVVLFILLVWISYLLVGT